MIRHDRLNCCEQGEALIERVCIYRETLFAFASPSFAIPGPLSAPSMSAAGQRCSESVRADAEHAADTASFPPFDCERLV
jgi:hypothetical protein